LKGNFRLWPMGRHGFGAGMGATGTIKTHVKPGGAAKRLIKRPGDWNCQQGTCTNLNYGWRPDCNKCGAPKPTDARGGSSSRYRTRSRSLIRNSSSSNSCSSHSSNNANNNTNNTNNIFGFASWNDEDMAELKYLQGQEELCQDAIYLAEQHLEAQSLKMKGIKAEIRYLKDKNDKKKQFPPPRSSGDGHRDQQGGGGGSLA